MNYRDTFAAAALTGLLANGDYNPSTPVLAFRMADAMLRERGNYSEKPNSSTNHDAAPAAKAMQSRDCSGVLSGTGDTPSEAEIDALEFVVVMGRVANGWDKDILRQWLMRLRPEFYSPEAIKEGESDRPQPIKEGESDRSQPIGSPAKTNPTQPRNGTPAEGSVPGEGSVPDSRSENEPVAWAVMQNDWYHDAHLDYYKAVKLATAANVAGAKNPWNVVPLYRHPPCQDLLQKNFTLTDEEREAVEWYAGYGRDGLHADTLRKLLERTK